VLNPAFLKPKSRPPAPENNEIMLYCLLFIIGFACNYGVKLKKIQLKLVLLLNIKLNI
jgi:hypothetical protein